jgi:hypothetical protein
MGVAGGDAPELRGSHFSSEVCFEEAGKFVADVSQADDLTIMTVHCRG